MGSTTVNISFTKDLLKQIDAVAGQESRSRSELIREAARSYIERKKKWDQIFKVGAKLAESRGLSKEDIETEIESYRKEKQR